MEQELRFLRLLITNNKELYTPFRIAVLRELPKVDFSVEQRKQLLLYDPDSDLYQWNEFNSPIRLVREEGCVFVVW